MTAGPELTLVTKYLFPTYEDVERDNWDEVIERSENLVADAFLRSTFWENLREDFPKVKTAYDVCVSGLLSDWLVYASDGDKKVILELVKEGLERRN